MTAPLISSQTLAKIRRALDEESHLKPKNHSLLPKGQLKHLLSLHLLSMGSSIVTPWGELPVAVPSFPGQELLADLAKNPGHWSGRGQDIYHKQTSQALPFTDTNEEKGHGTTGRVVKADFSHGGTTVTVARKIVQYSNDGRLKHIRSEIDILKKVCHQHIVTFVGSVTQERFISVLLYPCAVCDLAVLLKDLETARSNAKKPKARSKPTLEQLGFVVKPNGESAQLSQAAVHSTLRRICGCVASAILYLHENKIRHKDLKPSNILLDEKSVYVTDFGIAKDLADQDTMATNGHHTSGTRLYMAPESSSGTRRASMDIYALGLIFMEIFTYLMGKSSADMKQKVPEAYSSPTCDQRINAALRIAWALDIIPATASRANIGVRDLIIRMLSLNPSDRPDAFGVVTELLALDAERYFCAACQQYLPHIKIRDWKDKYILLERKCAALGRRS